MISFVKLSRNSKVQIDAITKQYDPYSDFNFTSLYCWDTDDTAEFAIVNDGIVVRMPDYTTGEKVCSLLSSNNPAPIIEALLQHTDELRFVPQITIDALPIDHSYQIVEDDEHHDYIYDLQSIGNLRGRPYSSIRNKINQFKSLHPDFECEVFESLSDILSKEIMDVTSEWLSGQPGEDGDESESLAIKRFLEHADNFNFVGVGLRVGERLIGFSINEILDDGYYGICHLQKVIKTYKNADALLTHCSSKILADKGCKRINWEQDLGIPGLRRLKRSYSPISYLKKYKVTKSD